MKDLIMVEFIHYEHDEKTEAYARKKFAKVQKYLKGSIGEAERIEVRLTAKEGKKTNQFECEATVNSRDNNYVSQARTSDMYASIDSAQSKLETQLRRAKTKRTSRKANIKSFKNFLRSRKK